jgi:hypothetical protein
MVRGRWNRQTGEVPCLRAVLFGKNDTSGKLLAERPYFDNETVMKQINGQAEAASVPSLVTTK